MLGPKSVASRHIFLYKIQNQSGGVLMGSQIQAFYCSTPERASAFSLSIPKLSSGMGTHTVFFNRIVLADLFKLNLRASLSL